jgi:hypothetical protein
VIVLRPTLSREQVTDVCVAVLKALQSYALAKGAEISAEDFDAYTELVARVVPATLLAAGCSLPWLRNNDRRH